MPDRNAADSDDAFITEAQIKAWRKYEKVRKGGKFNMFDPRARKAAGLDTGTYLFVMHNFTLLKHAAETGEWP